MLQRGVFAASWCSPVFVHPEHDASACAPPGVFRVRAAPSAVRCEAFQGVRSSSALSSHTQSPATLAFALCLLPARYFLYDAPSRWPVPLPSQLTALRADACGRLLRSINSTDE